MSAENVEIVRRTVDAFQAGDRDYWRGVFAPDIVWDLSRSDLLMAEVLHGHEGVERFFRDWLGTWEDYEATTLELIDAGDAVVHVFHQRGRGRGSGVETERDYFGVYFLENGRIVRYVHFESREEALAEAGAAADESA